MGLLLLILIILFQPSVITSNRLAIPQNYLISQLSLGDREAWASGNIGSLVVSNSTARPSLLKARQFVCEDPSYSFCPGKDYCCPVGGACCGDFQCCKTGSFCCGPGCCPDGSDCCSSGECCPEGTSCCGDGCALNGDTCCQTYSCPSGQGCCGTFNGQNYCKEEGQECCSQGFGCNAGYSCCGVFQGQPYCAPSDGVCCSQGYACPSNTKCCGTSCIPNGSVCCNNGYCPAGTDCCGQGCNPNGTTCCANENGYCPRGWFCCGNGWCAEDGGECCSGGGSCPPGLKCATFNGEEVCCVNGECGNQSPKSQIRSPIQTSSEASTTTSIGSSTNQTCGGASFTYYNSSISSTLIVKYDCSCPAIVSEEIGLNTTEQSRFGFTCTITAPPSSSTSANEASQASAVTNKSISTLSLHLTLTTIVFILIGFVLVLF